MAERALYIAGDGRSERGLDTRHQIIAACRIIMAGGNLRPTAQEVARVSGLVLRTIYFHFDRLEALYMTALDDPTTFNQVMDLLLWDGAGRADWRRMLRAIVTGQIE